MNGTSIGEQQAPATTTLPTSQPLQSTAPPPQSQPSAQPVQQPQPPQLLRSAPPTTSPNPTAPTTQTPAQTSQNQLSGHLHSAFQTIPSTSLPQQVPTSTVQTAAPHQSGRPVYSHPPSTATTADTSAALTTNTMSRPLPTQQVLHSQLNSSGQVLQAYAQRAQMATSQVPTATMSQNGLQQPTPAQLQQYQLHQARMHQQQHTQPSSAQPTAITSTSVQSSAGSVQAPTQVGANQPSAQPQQQTSHSQRPPPPAWYEPDKHMETRKTMIMNIGKLLQAKRPNAPQEWMRKSPQVARCLEESLFRQAPSFDEYRDPRTLKMRLQKLASDMGMRAQSSAPSGAQSGQQTSQSRVVSQSDVNPMMGQSAGAQQQPPQPAQAQASSRNTTANAQRQQVLRQQQQRLLLLRHASKCPHGEPGKSVTAQNHVEGARVVRGPDWKWAEQDGGKGKFGLLGKKRNNGWTAVVWDATKEERMHRIGVENSYDLQFAGCPVTQHCAVFKDLWKHIADCKNQQCQVAHCVSSRYVLSHYHRCRERNCAVCQPVRQAIARNHEKAKELQARSRRGGSGATSQPAVSKTPIVAKLPPPPQRKERPHHPPDPTASIIYQFTDEQIKKHVQSLRVQKNLKPSVIRSKCSPVLKRLWDAEFGWIFQKPVNPVELNLPDYFQIVKKPMDFGTIRKKLENQGYRDVEEFAADIHLTFDNSILYNGESSDVTQVARLLKKKFDAEWKKVQMEIAKEQERGPQKQDLCKLCGIDTLNFEPPVYYCNGAACNGQRIRRNSYYYVCPHNKFHWCTSCYGDLQDGGPLEGADGQVTKADLKKKKNDEQHEESWVNCDRCDGWVHQICALFNGRRNQSAETVYHCPSCVLETRAQGKGNPPSKIEGAKDIQHTTFSKYIEDWVLAKLEGAYKETQAQLGRALRPEEKAGSVFVRQLSNLKSKTHLVRPRMAARYKDQGFPDDFPVTSKCIVLFENIDGVDVILFGMYVYEYGHKAPQPNHRRVYVSYLDSVHYFRPRQYRTLVYHEMLVAYMRYVKERGFHTCHIWACPPCKGDDYIFFCHPEEQKTPKEDRLRNWYITMLKKCQEEGSVIHLTNLHEEHFKDPESRAVDVPYFEGDYWISEAEAILKALEEEKEQRTEGGKKAKGAKKSKKNKNKRGLRSEGDFEELNGRDPLVVRMGKTLEHMKEAFIVAHLNTREYAAQMWERRLKEIELEKQLEKSSDDTEADEGHAHKRQRVVKSEAQTDEAVKSENGQAAASEQPAMDIEPKPEPEGIPVKSEPGAADAATVAKKEEGEPSTSPVDAAVEGTHKRKHAQIPTDETEDPDDQLESDFFDTRQSYLNLCQGNHYQFDTLRRAKHTSVMSLYHIHNPDIPKFLTSCSICQQEINSGFRYDCPRPSCQDFHCCQDCYSRAAASSPPVTIHPHQLKRVNVLEKGPATHAQKLERQRFINLHMQLLAHAASCTNPECPSQNCQRMKGLLQHGKTCQKAKTGCGSCRRLHALYSLHAQRCRKDNCPVPRCAQLKERLRNLELQQAQMDERRRQAMNEQYARPAASS